MKRHYRDNYLVQGEGIIKYQYKKDKYDKAHKEPVTEPPSTEADLRKFRFSRLGPKGQRVEREVLLAIANAMVAVNEQPDSEGHSLPAGYTYLGQFIDHDMTMDNTAVALGDNVTVNELKQGRSPALDLDSLYGRGPENTEDSRFYADNARLKVGVTAATPFPDAGTNVDLDGFDLPRVDFGSQKAERIAALIPDHRNDENLAVAQTHLAFIRFHNKVVDKLASDGVPSIDLFRKARELVVKHYQWMLKTDFLPRLVDPEVIQDVFDNGRKFFDHCPKPGNMPTMPIEFSVAAYRLGHSMVRNSYQWNRVFSSEGPGPDGTLDLLFRFSGTSGNLSPDGELNDPESGSFERLPTNWIADFRRLYDFAEANRDDLTVADVQFNAAKRVDTLMVDLLKTLPLGSFGERSAMPPTEELNLAFRNLMRANMVELASGQQMAQMFGLEPLSAEQIISGIDGAKLETLTDAQQKTVVANTPLWFYILRESELNKGRLTGVGARIMAEVFHRSIEGSKISILRDPAWKPSLGPDDTTFRMVDLLLFSCDHDAKCLNPLGTV